MNGLARMFAVAAASLAFASCSSGSSPAPPGPSPYIDGFNPPALQAGYTRFITPPIRGIPAGTDQMWCQWLAAPAAADQDVLHMTGQQSSFGHHAVLYASKTIEAVGTTRQCTSSDMESVQYLGGIGAEGTMSVALPPGVVFRLPQGQALMANVHFINATSHPIDGQAVLDLDLQPPSSSNQVAGLFANVNALFSIPPHSQSSADATCVAGTEMPFLLFGNHMHQWGTSVTTEVVHTDGTKTTIVDDPNWTPEREFNPRFVSFPLGQPLVIHQGETVHTHCVWTGDATQTLTFPSEMCLGFGFFVNGGRQVTCVDGQWPTQ
jgi:hypothetical protein